MFLIGKVYCYSVHACKHGFACNHVMCGVCVHVRCVYLHCIELQWCVDGCTCDAISVVFVICFVLSCTCR